MLRTGLLLTMVLLVVGGGLPAASAPLAPLTALTYEAPRLMKVGDQLRLVLRGTSGGTATFHILNVASDIGMREIRTGAYGAQPAVYTGTYIVRPGDVARNALLFATLTARDAQTMIASTRPVTIDTRPPALTARYPSADVSLTNIRPNIVVGMLDAETQVNPSSVRLLVNGQNVTARASISATSVSYNPEAPFRPGPVRVQLSVADLVGNRVTMNWAFRITPRDGLIDSVTINPTTALTDDDVLTVVMAGAPGGRATFSVEGVRGDRPMRESRTRGVYFGTLAVRQLGARYNAPLIVTLERNGMKDSMPASVPVTILTGPPQAPTVSTSSRSVPMEDPTARLQLSGQSRPGYRILGRLDYIARSSMLEGTGTLGEFLAFVAPDGRWRTSLGPLVPLEQARLVVTVVAIDQAGQRSPPVTLELTAP